MRSLIYRFLRKCNGLLLVKLYEYDKYEQDVKKALNDVELAEIRKSNPKYKPKKPKMPQSPKMKNEFINFYTNIGRIKAILYKYCYQKEWVTWNFENMIELAFVLLVRFGEKEVIKE